MNRYFVLILCVFVASFGHVLFKSSANTLKNLSSFWMIAFEPVFISAMFLYALTTVGWIWCLQELPLSKAYLFMALAYVFIPLLSWAFFGELPTWQYFMSSVLIVFGIVVAIA